MPTCSAHNQEPAADYRDNLICYGDLWQCAGCGRLVCTGYGAADEQPDLCDSCAEKNILKKGDKTLASVTVTPYIKSPPM